MIALDCATETMCTTPRPGFLARAFNVVSLTYRALKNRRDFYRLSDMSDADLLDIGLTRSDLDVANARSSGLDPTTRLREIVEARNAPY